MYAEPRLNLGLKKQYNEQVKSKSSLKSCGQDSLPQTPRDINFHFKKQYLNKRNFEDSLQICNPCVSALLGVMQP